MLINLIKELSNLNGTSGDEKKIAEYILLKIQQFTKDVKIDNLGNVIAFKKGEKTPEKDTIMLSAHMDEVGFIVTYIEDNGLIRFFPVGGINSAVVIGSRVLVGQNKILGVIGNKPQHLLSSSEKSKVADFDNLFIDIGANNKDEVLKYINIGDFCYFNSTAKNMNDDNFLVGKAFDDRIGCAILLDILKEELSYDTYFCFNTREEVGLIGAKTVSHYVKPTVSIVVECTTAGDNLSFSGADKVCSLNDGVIISYMDRGCIYDYDLFCKAKNLATTQNIKYQVKTGIYGGNDSRAIQSSHNGCKVMALSVPARNLHTQSIVVAKSDIKATRDLTLKLLNNIV